MVSQLDAILTHLGTGKWSIVHFIVAAYISVFLVPHTLGGALLAPRLDYSCREPTITTTTTTTTYTTTTTATITPNVSIHQQANSSSVAYEAKCEYRIDTPDGERIEECVEFNFDNSTFSSTLTSEYNLACGRGYLQTSFQSVYMLGIFVGAPVNGYLSDKYGRKPMIVGGVVSYLILGVASAWLPLLSTILVARFLLGFAHAISCYTSYVLMVEVMEPKMRISAGYVVYTFWAFATMLYGLIGYFLRDWRILQTVLTLPGLLILPILWLIDESPRWLIVNGRREEALQVLGKVARWHGVDLPLDLLGGLEVAFTAVAVVIHQFPGHGSTCCSWLLAARSCARSSPITLASEPMVEINPLHHWTQSHCGIRLSSVYLPQVSLSTHLSTK